MQLGIIDLYHQEFCQDSSCAELMKEKLEGISLERISTKKYRPDFRALLYEAMGVSLWQREKREESSLLIREEERKDGQRLKYFLRAFHEEL